MSDIQDSYDRPRPKRRRKRPDYDDIEAVESIEEESDGIGDDVGLRMLLPVGRSGWAIASGYLGLLSVLLIPAPFAILTGILAIRHIRSNSKVHGMGRAIFGLIMGSLGTAVMLLILILIATGKMK
jgi:hypothetical protein